MVVATGRRHCNGVSEEEPTDRISNLLEPIIHYILSFLETIYVVRVSMVSRRWKDFWITMPYLNLDSQTFTSSSELVKSVNGFREYKLNYRSEGNDKFKAFVNWVLMTQNGSIDIQRFRISLGLVPYTTVHRWISVVIRRNVQELVLDSFNSNKLPYCIVSCFSRLKSLHLENVGFSNYILLKNFISSCPVLEILYVKSCVFTGFKILDISSPSLKDLTIYNFSCVSTLSLKNCEVHIACPKLESFTFMDKSVFAFSFENLNSLQNVFISLCELRGTVEECCYILERICNTKVLKLSEVFLEYFHLAFAKPEGFSTSFYNLKHLKLDVGTEEWNIQSMIKLLDCSPNLEALTILSVGSDFSEQSDRWKIMDKAIPCLTYHLKVVELFQVSNANELELVRFLLKNGHVLHKLSISWSQHAKNLIKIIPKVMKFPRSSSNVALTFLQPTSEFDIYRYLFGPLEEL